MALLKKSYNEENTVRTEIRSVEQTSMSFDHKIIKSTDSDLPEGINFHDEDGNLIAGVHEPKEDQGVFVAMVLTFTTTIAEVQASNRTNFEQAAESEAGKIKNLALDKEAQLQVIRDKRDQKLASNEACTTIQDAEKLTWNSVEEVTA